MLGSAVLLFFACVSPARAQDGSDAEREAAASVAVTPGEDDAIEARGSSDATAYDTPPSSNAAFVPPGYASTTESTDVALAPTPPRRVFGLGTALGGGIAFGGAYALGSGGASIEAYPAPALEIHSLEAMFFFDDHLSLDISIPLLNTIIIGIASGSEQIVPWGTNFLLDFSIGDDWVRFLVGPSVGIGLLAYRSSVFLQINVGAMLGLELLTRGRAFGFRIMTRPQAQFAITSVPSHTIGIGGVAMLELGFIGYFH